MRLQKKLLIICLLLPIAGYAQTKVTNQKLTDTMSFLPEYYTVRVASDAKEPIVQGKIIFLGNSITQLGDWKKLLNDTTVLNRGIAGDVTFGMLKRLDDITKRKPSKLFLLTGINDIGKDIPDAIIANNIRKIILCVRAVSPSTQIIVQSILPVNPDVPNFPQHYDKQEHILNTNKLIKKVTEDTHCSYADIHSLFMDKEGKLEANLTFDGLHLKPKGGGYETWVAYLQKQGCL